MSLILALSEQRQGGLCEFVANLIYRERVPEYPELHSEKLS